MRLITRTEAVSAGARLYFTGKPCKRGHLSTRRVNKSTCVSCEAEDNKQKRKASKEKSKIQRTYFSSKPCHQGHIGEHLTVDGSCVECYKLRHRTNQNKYRASDPEHVRKIVRKASAKAYKLDPGKYKAKTAKRRADKLRATPKWSNLVAIQQFYKNCPSGYQVDHIVPLRGQNVSGLHVINNLQYLPAPENASKKNKWPVSL